MKYFIYLFILLITVPFAHAYQSTMDNGEIVPQGKYRVLGELQYLGDPSGINLTGGFDGGVTEDSNIRVIAGTGSVSFHTGLFYKWIPFPDTSKQPAVGVMAGGTWARYNSENYPGFRIHPLVSKKFETDFGLLIPYSSLPFGIIAGPKRNLFPLQLVVGSEWHPVDVTDFSFLLELGLNLNESTNYISVGVLYALPE